MLKKVKAFILILSLCLLLSACVGPVYQDELLATYDSSERIPFDIKPIEGKGEAKEYAFFLSEYGVENKSIAVGTLDDYEEIYVMPEENWIYDICVSENYIVWFEESDVDETSYGYKLFLYDNKTKSQEVIFKEKVDADNGWYAIRDMGIYKGKIYWLRNDFAKMMSEIRVHDIKTGVQEVVHAAPFIAGDITNGTITSMKVRDNIIVYSQRYEDGEHLIAYDIEKNEKVAEATLKDSVGTVFGVDYEKETNFFAVYYVSLYKNGNVRTEAVGAVDAETGELKEFLELHEYNYLYCDRVSIFGDYIYYDIVSETSGRIEDNYQGVVYDYQKHEPQERKYVYNTMILDGNFYFLSFEKGEGASKALFFKERP